MEKTNPRITAANAKSEFPQPWPKDAYRYGVYPYLVSKIVAILGVKLHKLGVLHRDVAMRSLPTGGSSRYLLRMLALLLTRGVLSFQQGLYTIVLIMIQLVALLEFGNVDTIK